MITWDEGKRRKNLQDHGVDFADLESFFDGDLLTREDRRADYGERRFQTIGLLFEVALFVVWTPRGDEEDSPHLISARKAEKHEERAWFANYRR
jgi:uncharacterized protein